MNSRRIFLVMSITVTLLALLSIGLVVLGNNMLGKEAKKLLDLKLEDTIIEGQQSALLAANKEIEDYADLEKIAKAVVPQDKDQARTIREINKIAEESGIKLKTINFQASNLGQAAPAPTTSDEGSSGTTSTTPAAPPLTQVKAVEGIPGVYGLEITISPIETQPVTYSQFIGFLDKLEKNRRTANVEKITVTPLIGDSLTFSLTLNVYVKP